MKRLIFVLILAIFMAGCATEVKTAAPNADIKSKALKAPKGKALVYFVRPTSVGKPFSTPIICDGKRLGTLCGWYFIYAYLKPGKHHFVSQRDNTTEMDATFAAGKTYFIEVSMYPAVAKGAVGLALIDSKTGREKLQECTLSADNAAK